jgi:hypothetical protein
MMLGIPERVYREATVFVQYDDEAVIGLVRKGLTEDYLKYSIHGISVETRVAELLDFMEETGFSLRQAVDFRMKQTQAVVSAFPEEDTVES